MSKMSKEKCVYMAKLSEQAERYDEMKNFMRDICQGGQGLLSIEERNLLSVAYKNAVGSRRASWRIVSSVEQKEKSKGNAENEKCAMEYRVKVEQELTEICEEIISLLDKILKEDGSAGEKMDAESKVFYFKMKGDYYRYRAEFTEGADRDSAAEQAMFAYEDAKKTATADLVVTHPIRLGLSLNYSVFKYEVMNKPEEACAMARQAFEEAIAELDNVSEESYKDSTLIMQLLRDNLTLWTTDQQHDEDGAQ